MESKVIIVTAPSGAGKTTVVKHLLQVIPDTVFSISATTRAQRDREQDGVDYHFISIDTFQEKIQKGDFLEYEEVYQGVLYGTLQEDVMRLLDQEKKHVLFDVDVKGAQKIKATFGDRALAIFVAPPSFEELKQRLINRKTETQEKIKIRLERVELEMQYRNSFDYVLVNNILEDTLQEAEELVQHFISK